MDEAKENYVDISEVDEEFVGEAVTRGKEGSALLVLL